MGRDPRPELSAAPRAGAAAPGVPWPIIAGGLVVFLLTAVAVVFLVPTNMDEVLSFHALACRIHPASVLNTFREPCDGTYVLHGPFGLSVMRSYGYVGALSAALYEPFHAMRPGITTQYGVGLGWLVLFAWLLARSASRPMVAFCLALAFFPFVFQFVHDTGPIRVSAVAFAASAVLVRSFARRSAGLQIVGGVLAGALFALALEDKPFFIYLLIPVVFFAASGLVDTPRFDQPASLDGLRRGALQVFAERIWRAWPFALAAGIVLAIGGALVLFARTADGAFYLDYLRRARVALPVGDVFDSILNYLTVWLNFAHRVYDPPNRGFLAAVQVSTIVFYVACIGAAVVHVGRAFVSLRMVLLAASGVSMVAVFLATRNVWAGHHMVFIAIPAILILAELVAALPRRAAIALSMGFLVLNVAVAVIVLAKTPRVDTAWERDRILAALNREDTATSIVNHSSWGTYYIHALYAPKAALVVYTEPLVKQDAETILDLARRTGRRTLYQTCWGTACTAAALNAAFGNAVAFDEVSLGTHDWRLFKATVE